MEDSPRCFLGAKKLTVFKGVAALDRDGQKHRVSEKLDDAPSLFCPTLQGKIASQSYSCWVWRQD